MNESDTRPIAVGDVVEVMAAISVPPFWRAVPSWWPAWAGSIVAKASVDVRREELARLAVGLHQRFIAARDRLGRLRETIIPLLGDLEATLADPSREPDPEARQDFIDDRFRLQRKLLEAELELNQAAWALHTLAWGWNL